MLALVACSATQPPQSSLSPLTSGQQSPLVPAVAAQLPVAPSDAPPPSSGKASISGAIYSYTIMRVVPGTLFYLTPAVGPDKQQMPSLLIGPEVSNGDVQGMTDDRAQFTLNDIPPGNYFLIVWAPGSWAEAHKSATDTAPRLIQLTENQREPLGVVYVSWP